MAYIGAPFTDRFYRFGPGSRVMESGEFSRPEEISIGAGVFIRDGYWFNLVAPGQDGSPKIVIGDGSQCNRGLNISAVNRVELERNVLIGPNVYISDTDHQYREIGIPVLSQWITSASGRVLVGEGSWIGAGAVIVGNVRIGKGSVVGANSVVVRDIPDFCVAAGTPAQIVKVYDPAIRNWIRVRNEEEAQEALRLRRLTPLLSICIPTYNRASDLEKCLDSIYDQIGDNDLIEVRVSDNASTDHTPAVAGAFASRFNNFHYSRNETNIGADPNILHVLGLGKGHFVKLQGDDDFFRPGTLIPFLHLLHRHGDCSVFHINVLHAGAVQVTTGEGMSAFLAATSIYSSFITSLVVKRKELEEVPDPGRYLGTSLNQIYLQYELLRRNPHFCILHSSMFDYAGNQPGGYNFGRVFIDGYQNVLAAFVGSGLSESDVRRDKRRVWNEFVLPYYRRLAAEGRGSMVADFESHFTRHYESEEYYAEALAILRSLKPD